MNYTRFIVLTLCSTLLSCASIDKTDPLLDINLIVPGKTAEGYNIGDTINDTGGDRNVISTGSINDITQIELFENLRFDSIIVKKNSAVLFLKSNTIMAIAGLKIERRITFDAVMLSQGSDNFILKYGSSGLETIRRNNHKVHIYKESGIAIFDDNSDDFIDMYLIFSK